MTDQYNPQSVAGAMVIANTFRRQRDEAQEEVVHLRDALAEIARKGKVGPPDPKPGAGWYNLCIRLSAIAQTAIDAYDGGKR